MPVSQPYQANVTGTFANLPEVPCSHVSILNNTAGALLVRRADDSGNAAKQVSIPAGLSIGLLVNGKSSELQIQGTVTALGCSFVCN